MRARWKELGAVLAVAGALTAVVAALPKATGAAPASPGPSFSPVAVGTATIPKDIKYGKGSITLDLEQATIPVGGVVPWHCHAGPVTFIVVQGELTALYSDGTSRLLGPGDADIEAPGDVRSSENLGTEDVVVYIQFGPGTGLPNTIWLTGPNDKCRY